MTFGDQDEFQETRELVTCAFALGRTLGIDTIVVQADEISDQHLVEAVRRGERIIWIARGGDAVAGFDVLKDTVLVMPDASLNRLSQINLALFLAALNGLIGSDERVVGLSGVAGSQRLDTLVIAKPARDYPWLRRHAANVEVSHHLARLLEISLQMAREGREGSPIGAIFVLGDRDELSPYLRQLILNPLQGHPPAERSIHNPKLLETLRELAAVDGAFVVGRSGIVESAGTYLDAQVGPGQLTPGLGARHAAALGITVMTSATAIAISASSSTVSVYDNGETILMLEGSRHIDSPRP